MIDLGRQKRIVELIKKGKSYTEALREVNLHKWERNGIAMGVGKDDIDDMVDCGWAEWILEGETDRYVVGVCVQGKKYYF